MLATNVKTGKTQAETVTAVLVHHDTNRYDLTVKTSHGSSVIETTRTHLFWDTSSHMWVEAAALKYGDYLRTADGTRVAVVEGYVLANPDRWMWGFTVAGDHDFYVDVAASAVLVHNCPIASDGGAPLANSQATDMANRLGYRWTGWILRGQRVFTNGRNYIVQDIDSHTGGLWKMAKTISDLNSKTTRMGTYDYNLNRIGP